MCQWSSDSARGLRPAVATLLVVLIAGISAPAMGQDRTARWLESLGFTELLAIHLEERLQDATGDADARRRTASRLAEVYAALLRSEEDPENRERLVESSRRLLQIVPDDESLGLRVALCRNRYLSASKTMEDARIELATPSEIEAAVRELSNLSGELNTIRRSMARRVETLAKSRSRRVERRLTDAMQWQAMGALLEGWSRYYVGMHRNDDAELEKAQTAFGVVLQGDNPIPGPSEVSIDLQAVEGFARAMLGMGMTTATLVSANAAEGWFDRLQYPETDPGTRQSVPGWRIAALIDAGAFREVIKQLERLDERAGEKGDEALPVAWLRLAAVGGLRAAALGDVVAREVAATALAALAGRGELAQVQDLAGRFGTEAFGGEGFVFRYVRGIEQYRLALEAREAGDQSAATDCFENAVRELEAAVEAPDADVFSTARAGCLALVGWSLLELDRPAEAADAFEYAAERTSGDRRADALWGAIVALDRIVKAGGEEASDAAGRRDALTNRFVDAFPADDRAPSLLVRRIAVDDNPGEEDLAVLLGVPRSHPTWELARRRASQVLYRKFRAARTGDRGDPGRRMLEVADEVLQRPDRERGIFTDLRGLDGMLLRQGAEVSTDVDVHDADRAARYLAQIELAVERGGFDDLPDMLNEVEYRRIGLSLGGGDFEDASKRMSAMPVVSDTPEAVRWTRLSAQRVHRAAAQRIRGGRVEVSVARAAVVAGRRYLELLSEEAGVDVFEMLDQSRMLPIGASVATSLDALHRATADIEDGEEALLWYEAILERRPQDGSILEATAELAGLLGRNEQALDCWRRLLRGAPDGSELWWKARTRQIEALLEEDPTTASEVFDQLRVLYPDLGPDPWREQLLALDIRIEIALAEASTEASPDGGGS